MTAHTTLALVRPAALDDAAAALRRLGPEARCYAGGVKLLLDIREGRLDPGVIVDLKRIPELRAVGWEDARAGGRLRIGACVTYDEVVAACAGHPGLGPVGRMAGLVGNIRVRNTGTLGGNLAVADPHADPATVLTLMDAAIEVHGPLDPPDHHRLVSLEQFHPAPLAPDLRPGEFVSAVLVPPLPEGWGWSYERVQRLIQPTLTVAAAARVVDGVLRDVRLAIGCISPVALRLAVLEDDVRGLTPSAAVQVVAGWGGHLAEAAAPESDLWGSADYKVHIATVLLQRALRSAAQTGGESG